MSSAGRRASDPDLEAAAQQLFDRFKQEDEEGEILFEEASLGRLCTEKGLDVSEAQVRSIFADVKSKKRTDLTIERFQNALRKIADALSKSYEAMVADLAASAEDTSQSRPLGRAGERGLMSLYLAHNAAFRQRLVAFDNSGDALLLCIMDDKPGAAPKQGMGLKVAGAIIDRMPTKDLPKSSRARKSKPQLCPPHTFRITETGSTKSFLLQVCSHEVMKAWLKVLVEKDAVIKDSQEGYEEELSDPKFTLVPIGASGVGKSMLCHLLTGAMFVNDDGRPDGYEDEMFRCSSGLRSVTKAGDAKMRLRAWKGKTPVFEIMDTPGLMDSDGADADRDNIKAIVAKLQARKEVDVFLLVMNATNRFTPQEAQVIEVLDKILSSPAAGSFLKHTIIVLNRADQAAYQSNRREKIVDTIRDKILERQKEKSVKGDLDALVDEQGQHVNYEDPEIWEGLKKRTLLFPQFDVPKVTKSRADKSLNKILEHVGSFGGKRFDCTGAKEATTKAMELQAQVQEQELEMKKKDAKIAEMSSKIAELQQQKAALDDQERRINERLKELKEQGEDTRELEAEVASVRKNSQVTQKQIDEMMKAEEAEADEGEREQTGAGAEAEAGEGKQEEEDDDHEYEYDAKHKLVVVSSPTNGLDPTTGKFDFPVMEMLQCDMQEGKLIIGYSFAGDSIPYIDTQALQRAYMEAKADEKAGALAALTKAVKEGPWWGPYMGQVMGNVKALCQQGYSVTMVGIQGGPITQMEQAEMAKVKINIEADLRSANLGLDPVIELDLGLASYTRFAQKYRLQGMVAQVAVHEADRQMLLPPSSAPSSSSLEDSGSAASEPLPDWGSVRKHLFGSQCLNMPQDLKLLMTDKTKGMHRLFVSHCTKDASIKALEAIRSFAAALDGMDVFNPDEFFKTVDASKAEMAAQAAAHDVTIASMSPGFFRSGWCFAEIEGAVRAGKPVIAVYWGEEYPVGLMKRWVSGDYAAGAGAGVGAGERNMRGTQETEQPGEVNEALDNTTSLAKKEVGGQGEDSYDETLHPLVLAGQPEDELQCDCMGLYHKVPDKWMNGREVWQKTDPPSPPRYMFYAEEKEFPFQRQWFVGTLEQMNAGKPVGLLSVEGGEAVTPNLVDAEWQVWDDEEEDWEDAEEVTCELPPTGTTFVDEKHTEETLEKAEQAFRKRKEAVEAKERERAAEEQARKERKASWIPIVQEAKGEAKARKEAEERARKEAKEKARKEAEERARKEAAALEKLAEAYEAKQMWAKALETYQAILKADSTATEYYGKIAELAKRAVEELGAAKQQLGVAQEEEKTVAEKPFTEKWRLQGKPFVVPSSAIVMGDMIGVGGFAQVHEGTIHGVRCAIKKFVAPTTQMNDKIVDMLKRETRPLCRVRHQNIIRLHHICLERGFLCIALELAPNGSLEQYLQKHPDTSVAQRFFFCHGMVAGMKRLHENKPKPILHNDMKPPNMLVGGMLESKIADLGSSTGGQTTTQGIGATGSTLAYSAPEVMNNKPKSKQSDVYAFAITMYEVMTGQPAWAGMDATGILSSVLQNQRPAIPAGCHPWVTKTIQMCWVQEPGDRPSFDELLVSFNQARIDYTLFRQEPGSESGSESGSGSGSGSGGRGMGGGRGEMVVVVSSPGKSLEQEEVMGMVEALAEMRTDLMFGYDYWAGSSTNNDPRDQVVNWGSKESVAGSFWFKGFRERVQAEVLVLVQLGYRLRLLCIEGVVWYRVVEYM
eukprot:g215.t1